MKEKTKGDLKTLAIHGIGGLIIKKKLPKYAKANLYGTKLKKGESKFSVWKEYWFGSKKKEKEEPKEKKK